MGQRSGEILLWLLVIWTGVQLGAGLYEKRVVVPQWSSSAPGELGAALDRTGQKDAAFRFWVFVSPPVALLALGNLAAAWQSHGSPRSWWLAAAVLMALYSAFTYGYFVPTMIRLWEAESLPPAEVRAAVSWWVGLNYLRLVLGACGWLAALKALSLIAVARAI